MQEPSIDDGLRTFTGGLDRQTPRSYPSKAATPAVPSAGGPGFSDRLNLGGGDRTRNLLARNQLPNGWAEGGALCRLLDAAIRDAKDPGLPTAFSPLIGSMCLFMVNCNGKYKNGRG